MTVDLVPIVLFTTMFSMIFGIAYLRNRENMALIERGLDPRVKDTRPRPFVYLKWGLLLIGSGLGLLFAYIIDNTIIKHDKPTGAHTTFSLGSHHNTKKIKTVIISDSSRLAKDTSLALNEPDIADSNGDDDGHSITEFRSSGGDENPSIYIALIAIGGGLGLFFSYRIEKKEWLDKKVKE